MDCAIISSGNHKSTTNSVYKFLTIAIFIFSLVAPGVIFADSAQRGCSVIDSQSDTSSDDSSEEEEEDEEPDCD